MKKRENNETDQRPDSKNFRETYSCGMINQRARATKYFDMVSTLINFMFKTLQLNRKKIST